MPPVALTNAEKPVLARQAQGARRSVQPQTEKEFAEVVLPEFGASIPEDRARTGKHAAREQNVNPPHREERIARDGDQAIYGTGHSHSMRLGLKVTGEGPHKTLI
jgi:hypothetical protein